MAVTINASTTTGLVQSADTSGIIQLQSNGTTAVTIDTNQRAAFVAGTAALPAITTTGDTNTGIFFSAADTIDFAEGGTATGQFDSSGNFKFNSGYGSVATAYGCRAWVNFDGFGTPAIRASGNVSSITDLGTGVYRVNFSTALVDGNYSVVASNIGSVNTLYYTFIASNNVANSTTSCQFEAVHQSSSINDQASISVAVFR